MTNGNDLFSDDVLDATPDDGDIGQESSDFGQWFVPVAVTLGILLMAMGGVIFWPSGGNKVGTTSITVSGSDVGSLKAGSPVMLEQIQVGEVESVSIRQGIPVASLKMSKEHIGEIPPNSRFEVGSLNWLLPGNIGVKVVPADTAPKSASDRAAEIAVDDSMLPIHVPTNSYLAIAVLLGAIASAAGVMLKIARSQWVGKTVLVMAIAILVYLFWTGTLRVEQIQDLLRAIPTQSEPVSSESVGSIAQQ
jgi:MlaD protein